MKKIFKVSPNLKYMNKLLKKKIHGQNSTPKMYFYLSRSHLKNSLTPVLKGAIVVFIFK